MRSIPRLVLLVVLALALWTAPCLAQSPTVAATTVTQESSDVTSHTFNNPTGIASGHLLIHNACFRQPGTITGPSGFTQLYEQTNGNATASVWYKFASGSEGSTVSFSTTNATSGGGTAYRITGMHASAAPEIGTRNTGTSTTPDPSATTPSWGAQATLWIAQTCIGSTVTVSAYPTSYSNGLSGVGAGSVPGTAASAERQLNAASDNPSTFTINASIAWVAGTIAVRPVGCSGGMLLMGIGSC